MFVWIMIALGIYECSVQFADTGENSDKTVIDKTIINETIVNEMTANDEKNSEIFYDENALDGNVRILLMTKGYQYIYHTELHLMCSEGLTVTRGEEVTDYEPGSEFVLTAAVFQEVPTVCIIGKNNGKIQITNIGRNNPAQYRGKLECHLAAEGIVVVNELLVEEYLYGVLPSEMPSSYPDEALKAQAISARTYTYFHKKSYAYPAWKAHMDDSTAYQVYLNCEETPQAIKAVDETKNQVLTYEGELVESFYYSTSSGYNGGARVWKDTVSAADDYLIETGEELFASNSEEGEQAYRQYIDNGDCEDVEYNEAWYRWNYVRFFHDDALKTFLGNLYELSKAKNGTVRIRSRVLPSDQLPNETAIRDIRILNRKKSGMVSGLMIETEHFRVSVMSQQAIRQALGCVQDIVIKKDGSSYIMGDTLPSAYFYLEKIYDNNGETGDTLEQVIIHGAGFGHGCGLSQNGAKGLASQGLTAAQILAYYYNGSIKDIGEFGE